DGAARDVSLRGVEIVGPSRRRRALGDIVLAGLGPAGVPAQTALRPNFPNPFNPETWIPFDLAHAAAVVVTVYDGRGVAVRRWDLGSLDAGAHEGRDAAVYWDGRGASGEPAASGAYYVELRAGDNVSVRRLLLAK
ncbi:hypothetical protein HOI71_23160, partial [Candidatus Poribacteria bacterium]|nr:hypothetical protein [Candidatus Poribacteria bacterium]